MADKIIKYKKPELAVLEQGIKIRDLPNQAEVIEKLVILLLTDLGVSDKADENAHVRVGQFLVNSLNNYTLEEIIKAFELFVLGELPIKAYQQLNVIVVGRVMREYEIHKREKLRLYRLEQTKLKNMKKPLTEAEETRVMLDAVDRVKKEIEDSGKADPDTNNHHIYDWMVRSGRISDDLFTPEEKREAVKKAKAMRLKDFMEKAMTDYDVHRTLKTATKDIEDGNSPRTLKLAKSILINEYLKKHSL